VPLNAPKFKPTPVGGADGTPRFGLKPAPPFGQMAEKLPA
jgi:hypothetical protein